ncbi:MAG: hypothetical protein U0736_15485 [Gemmataceae bacterium]
MTAYDPLDAFYLTLDESPGDPVTLLALADWYEEALRPDAAACLRWTVQHKYIPFRYTGQGQLTVFSESWNKGWVWWAIDDPAFGRDWGHPSSCRLPAHVWDELRHTFHYDPAVFKEYPSSRAAYEALLDVWPRLQPIHRPRPRREKNRR